MPNIGTKKGIAKYNYSFQQNGTENKKIWHFARLLRDVKKKLKKGIAARQKIL